MAEIPMMDALAAFLNARLKEMEEAALESKNAPPGVMRYLGADLVFRRVEAGRTVLRNWQDAVIARNRATGRHVAAAIEAERNWQDAVRLSAAIWDDHPDYRPEWATGGDGYDRQRRLALTDGSLCPDCGGRLFYRHGSGVDPPPGLDCFGCGWAQDYFLDAARDARLVISHFSYWVLSKKYLG